MAPTSAEAFDRAYPWPERVMLRPTVAVAAITKDFVFEASHVLPNHKGKCGRLHGHSYGVTIELEGAVKNRTGAHDEGMVVDYAQISLAWRSFADEYLDHRHLNDTLPCLPTAENIAGWILRTMRAMLPVIAVEVRETAQTSARVTR